MLVNRGFGKKKFLIGSILLILLIVVDCNEINNSDPFRSLGIPDLNPKQLLNELDEEHKNKGKLDNNLPQLKTIEDLPNFLKNSNMNEEEGVKILTRFLIQDDATLKKMGVVYDQTGFDGITSGEKLSPAGTEERLIQRARSAANIWVRFYILKYSLSKNIQSLNMMLMVQRILWKSLYLTGEFTKYL